MEKMLFSRNCYNSYIARLNSGTCNIEEIIIKYFRTFHIVRRFLHFLTCFKFQIIIDLSILKNIMSCKHITIMLFNGYHLHSHDLTLFAMERQSPTSWLMLNDLATEYQRHAFLNCAYFFTPSTDTKFI
jgi:hypothetical protein